MCTYAGGDYEQHVAHPGVEENDEQDEDEEDAYA